MQYLNILRGKFMGARLNERIRRVPEILCDDSRMSTTIKIFIKKEERAKLSNTSSPLAEED
jgi:hypothetical protein